MQDAAKSMPSQAGSQLVDEFANHILTLKHFKPFGEIYEWTWSVRCSRKNVQYPVHVLGIPHE
jgi:hypothetical protein